MHQSCKRKVTNSKFQCFTQKPKHDETEAPIEIKRTQSKIIKFDKNKCFIPGCKVETTKNESLLIVMSKELNSCFREYASFTDDKELLTKLANGDLIAFLRQNITTRVELCITIVSNRRFEKNSLLSEVLKNSDIVDCFI